MGLRELNYLPTSMGGAEVGAGVDDLLQHEALIITPQAAAARARILASFIVFYVLFSFHQPFPHLVEMMQFMTDRKIL